MKDLVYKKEFTLLIKTKTNSELFKKKIDNSTLPSKLINSMSEDEIIFMQLSFKNVSDYLKDDLHLHFV
jgi:hypothetical protein